MDAGELRDRVTIRRQSNVKNEETGGLTRSWADLANGANIPAKVVSLNGREALINQVLQNISHFEITTRFRRDLQANDQIRWLTAGGRELNIHTAEDRAGTRQWLTIVASTLAPQGA